MSKLWTDVVDDAADHASDDDDDDDADADADAEFDEKSGGVADHEGGPKRRCVTRLIVFGCNCFTF